MTPTLQPATGSRSSRSRRRSTARSRCCCTTARRSRCASTSSPRSRPAATAGSRSGPARRRRTRRCSRPISSRSASVKFRKKALVAGRHDHGQGPQHAGVGGARRSACCRSSDLVLSAPRRARSRRPCGRPSRTPRPSWTARLPEVAVMCFGEAGTPTTFATARASTRRDRAREDRVGHGAAHVALPHATWSRPERPNVPPVAVVVGFLVVGMVIGIAAFFVTREATRIAKRTAARAVPPRRRAGVGRRPPPRRRRRHAHRRRRPPHPRVPGRVLQAQGRVVERLDRVPAGHRS